MKTISVAPQGFSPYDVKIGPGALDELPPLVDGAARVAVLASVDVPGTAERIAEALADAGVSVLRKDLPAGESAKSIDVAVAAWDELGAAGFTRSDMLIGVGGGAATDLAGFVAATWLRGIAVVQVPTTTAGMVDAAVGGKTGINTTAGKNLVGAFHQPRGVLADTDVLSTLPIEHHRAGLAEVVKCGLIADPVILDLIAADPAAALDTGSDVVRELIERAVQVKAEVVTEDAREASRREILNYGHTLGHAIERVESYSWRHGDAVSVGMVFAAALSAAAGRLDEPTRELHSRVLASLGLPLSYDGASREELMAGMRVDKKSRADRLRFVVLDGLARPAILDNPDPGQIATAFEAVGA